MAEPIPVPRSTAAGSIVLEHDKPYLKARVCDATRDSACKAIALALATSVTPIRELGVAPLVLALRDRVSPRWARRASAARLTALGRPEHRRLMLAHLTLTQLKLGLRELVGPRWEELQRSPAGRFHGPALKRQLEQIEALPGALTGGEALASELDAADVLHDGYGAAIYFATEVAFCLPDATPEFKAAARRIRDALIPDLQELHAPYFVEADRAQARRPLLEQLEHDLRLFHVSGQGTLYDVAAKFLHAGDLLQELLSQRTDIPAVSRRKALDLRSRTAALLHRLREDLRLEAETDASIAGLEPRLFARFDAAAPQR